MLQKTGNSTIACPMGGCASKAAEEVVAGSVWVHTNGNRYMVLMLANEFTEHPDRYPATVVYRGENGRIWSRALSDWHRSMSPSQDQDSLGPVMAIHAGDVTVADPETGASIEMEVFKDPLSGGMVAVDASYLDQASESFNSPFGYYALRAPE